MNRFLCSQSALCLHQWRELRGAWSATLSLSRLRREQFWEDRKTAVLHHLCAAPSVHSRGAERVWQAWRGRGRHGHRAGVYQRLLRSLRWRHGEWRSRGLVCCLGRLLRQTRGTGQVHPQVRAHTGRLQAAGLVRRWGNFMEIRKLYQCCEQCSGLCQDDLCKIHELDHALSLRI